ncbi:MAG TPA: glycosyltransferase [Hanamia sp.]|nr:glycosyltransferase [Hanamia sp.]
MTKFSTIPKLLPARNPMEYSQKIPKIIWQTMKTNQVPGFMKDYADSWINSNPEYEYRFLDDNDIIDFIKKEFPEYLEGYTKLKYGASKADLWRYLIIYRYGGVYADMDCKCLTPLRKWIDQEAAFVTQLGINKDLCQWLIISVPQNPIFLKAAHKTIQNSENNNSKTSHHGFFYSDNKILIREKEPLLKFEHPVLGLSGPPVLQAASEECYQDGSISDILLKTQVVCVSDSKTSCQMNGHVIHDTRNLEYKKSLRKVKVTHYNGRIEKVKRKILSLFPSIKQ